MSSQTRQGWLAPFSAAIPLIVLPIAVLSIPLAAAENLGLSTAQIASWILAVYGLTSVVSMILSYYYRQPLLITGNVFVLIFIASLGRQLSFAELIGALMVTGACVLALGALGLTPRLAEWIPAPVVMGVLAGAIMPFVSGIFTSLGDWPGPIGGALIAYLWGKRLNTRLPPILPAAIALIAIAALAGDLTPAGSFVWVATPQLTLPVFSLEAILTAVPVMIVVITLQSNVPSLIFLRNQGYDPPERVITLVSGVGTIVGSLLGPTALSLSLPATSLAAGPDAGQRSLRHRTVYIGGVVVLVIGLMGDLAAELPAMIPRALLLALAGLATVSVLARALHQITEGPLLLGPLFAFAIALSDVSLLGLGPIFWALVIGTAVSQGVERERRPAPAAEVRPAAVGGPAGEG